MKAFPALERILNRRPATWQLASIGRLLKMREEARGASFATALSLGSAAGLVSKRAADARQQPSDEYLRRYWLVEPGDLVVNPMWLIGGAIGVSQVAGSVSPDYRVFSLPRSVHPQYLHHLLRSQPYFDQYRLLVRAETTFDRRVTKQDFAELPIIVPSVQEQRAIADYLDVETARIDALIAKKRGMVDLLEEHFEASVVSAFTSSSGLRFKGLLAAPLAYGVLVPRHDPEGVPMLRINDFAAETVDLASVARIPQSLSFEFRRTIVQTGDLVLSVVGTMGRCAQITPQLAGSNLNRPLARVQLQPDIGRDLIRIWLGSKQFMTQARLATSSDSAQPTLNLSDLREFRLGLPLDRSAWPVIERAVVTAEAARDLGRRLLTRQIDLLREHRQALITAAVNGELDIPAVAV